MAKKKTGGNEKHLMIVESPAKAKTLEKFLDDDFIVKSSYGHIRDLPKTDKAIDVNNRYHPTYEVSADKKEVVKELKKLAKQACKLNPDDCGLVEGQYKDAIFQFVTPVEDEAKKRWKDTLARASQMGVTNDYVKKARENLSKYLPDEFPFIKDERVGLEYP